jgi:hypothetical protein
LKSTISNNERVAVEKLWDCTASVRPSLCGKKNPPQRAKCKKYAFCKADPNTRKKIIQTGSASTKDEAANPEYQATQNRPCGLVKHHFHLAYENVNPFSRSNHLRPSTKKGKCHLKRAKKPVTEEALIGDRKPRSIALLGGKKSMRADRVCPSPIHRHLDSQRSNTTHKLLSLQSLLLEISSSLKITFHQLSYPILNICNMHLFNCNNFSFSSFNCCNNCNRFSFSFLALS